MSQPPSIASPISKTIEELGMRLMPIPHFDQVLSHLSSLITHFNDRYQRHPREAILKMESLLSFKKWASFSSVNHSLACLSSGLSEAEINSAFLGDGLCAGATIQYLSQFFKTRAPLGSSPLSLRSEPVVCGNIRFYPIEQTDIEAKAKRMRFLQAAYRIATSSNISDSFEYFPEKLLTRNELSIARRLPVEKTCSYSIDALITILKNLKNEELKETGYLFGLAGNQNHALALHLQPPYLFFDLRFGLAISDHQEDFLLFFANYLTEKYPDFPCFALLEFRREAH